MCLSLRRPRNDVGIQGVAVITMLGCSAKSILNDPERKSKSQICRAAMGTSRGVAGTARMSSSQSRECNGAPNRGKQTGRRVTTRRC